jgi:protein-S-isoprenylcysteine O-methyltransferase Ste14
MKAKITSVAIFVILAYLIPLAGNISLIPTIQVGILSIFVVVMLTTQPPLRFTEAKADRGSDKNSVIFILLGFLLGQMATIIEWAYFTGYHKWIWDSRTVIGLALMTGGTIFRVWCIRTLGKFFTATVKTQEKQQIITSGAYRVVRHPSYSGAFVAATGSAVFMHTSLAVVINFIVLFTVYYFRIKAEEATLTGEFGNEYISYRSRTKKLIPFIY